MKIAVIGAGAAGCMAAVSAAERNADVTVFDHNEKIGKKLYITGKGRCNFTNDEEDFFAGVVHNPKFLYAALNAFSPKDTLAFFENAGVPYKIERGGRAFPQSDKSSDIITALAKKMKSLGVTVQLNQPVTGLDIDHNQVAGVVTDSGGESFDRVIVATGGISYPSTGSTGDGYSWAKRAGHRIVPLRAALVPIRLKEIPPCVGLSLKNVRLEIKRENRILCSEFGEMLFTDEGISGSIVLTLSSRLSSENLSDCVASIDLKPALSYEKLDERLQRDFKKYANRDFVHSMHDLLPSSLIPVVIKQSGIPFDKKTHQITSAERRDVLAIVKSLCYPIKGTDTTEHAIVTAGGVDTAQINPSSMESRIVRHLYFAGEILDLDALTGGYNLQIAFSTGWLAGEKSAQ